MATRYKRTWDVVTGTTDHGEFTGIEHHPTRRKLNTDVPSILVIKSEDYSTDSSGSIDLSTSPSSSYHQHSNVQILSSESSSPLPCPDRSFTNTSLLGPFNRSGDNNSLSHSPNLSPTGMQMLSLDSDIEMEIESQTGGETTTCLARVSCVDEH